ncbi:type I-E CRISPR-associated protein Cas7/Cse4/CasC [Streptomyces sp. NPDC058049]|uniref:type I-E CRISPR-associated protein Cas7/Cse4/CasC n=1 Tax=Streptomyces sp. NPDC058049 TaxID=3346314 RepID=UPI0036E20B7C
MAPYAPARFIDLHVLQPVPASLLNRGEDNEPKSLLYGGVMRSMVSPQAWKRAIRLDMEQELGEHAVRTRNLPLKVAEALTRAGWPTELATFAGAQVARSASTSGLKIETAQKGITSALLYVRQDSLDQLTDLCQAHRQDLEEGLAEQQAATTDKQEGKKTGKKDDSTPAVLPTKEVAAIIKQRTATINLFGRMLTEIADAGVDGAVQIAPAFSVHQSDAQPDYFTAVEDWSLPGQSGSAHLQTGFFTTGVLYRYTTVNLTELIANLDGDHNRALHLLTLYARTFIDSLPQAKRTSTAPHTLPHLAHYTVRDRRPVSYAAAFERPVRHAHGGGHTRPATEALCEHARQINRLLGTRHLVAAGHTTLDETPLDHLGTRHDSFDTVVDALTAAAAGKEAM